MKIVCLTLAFLLIFSCGQHNYEEPDFYFQGEFDSSLVNVLDKYIKELATEQGFLIYEKKHSQMETLTNGNDAFYISFYEKDSDALVLYITNVGVGTELTLGLYATNNISLKRAKELSATITNYLKTELNVEMILVDPIAFEN